MYFSYLSNSYMLSSTVLAAIGTVIMIWILEKIWSMVAGAVTIDDRAEEALNKMVQDSSLPRGLLKPRRSLKNMPID